MSRQITLPVNQVRLTNVAVVRMYRCGKRFEIACYKNKIINYRQKIECNLSEVLQTDRVFANVSRGQFSSSSDLKKAFHTKNQKEICKIILNNGIIQSSGMERSVGLENTYREIASMVSSKCVHPETNRPYSVHQIRVAMSEAKFNVQSQSNRSVKQHFLDCVRALQVNNVLDIIRARMELAVVVPECKNNEILQNLQYKLKENCHTINLKSNCKLIFQIDPCKYRTIQFICQEGPGRLEILRQVVMSTSDVNIGPIKREDTNHDQSYVHSCDINDKEKDFNSSFETKSISDTSETTEKYIQLCPTEIYSDLKCCGKELQQGMNNILPSRNVYGKSIRKEKKCSTCCISLMSSQFLSHFRSEWHIYNIKLKIKGLPPLRESDFKMINLKL